MQTATNGTLLMDQGDWNKEGIFNRLANEFDKLTKGQIVARAYHNADQSITTSTLTAVALNSETDDTDVMHDTSTNNSRLTIKTAGRFRFSGCVVWGLESATGQTRAFLRHTTANGVTVTYFAGDRQLASTSINVTHNLSGVFNCAVGDYVELVVWQNSGAGKTARYSVNVDASGYVWAPVLCGERV